MIALEYAKALFELAESNNKVEEINDQFQTFIKLINENEDYLKILTYPNILDTKKKDCIKKTLIGFDDLFIDFLFVLIDKKRMSYISEIANEYTNLERANSNICLVDVYSAVKLNKDELQSVKNKLAGLISEKQILVNNIVDEALIGGIKAVYDGKEVDFSLTKKLNNLKKSL